MAKNKHKASLVFIFITVLVDIIGVGIIIPVIPTLIKNLTRGGLSDAAFYDGLLITLFGLDPEPYFIVMR